MEIIDRSTVSDDVLRQLKDHAETAQEEVDSLQEKITQIEEEKGTMQTEHEEELKKVALDHEKWQESIHELFNGDIDNLSPEECCAKLRQMKAALQAKEGKAEKKGNARKGVSRVEEASSSSSSSVKHLQQVS